VKLEASKPKGQGRAEGRRLISGPAELRRIDASETRRITETGGVGRLRTTPGAEGSEGEKARVKDSAGAKEEPRTSSTT